MRVSPLAAFLCFSIAGFAQSPDKATEPRRLGDLVVELARTNTPSELLQDQGKVAPPSDQYWVVAEVSFHNAGKSAVCSRLAGSLKAETGLLATSTQLVSELLPGEEAVRNFVFTVKRGTNPLELLVEAVSYGGQCGDSLPPSAARSVQFPIQGVSSPKDDKSGAGASSNPAVSPVSGPGGFVGGAYKPGGGVTAPIPIVRPVPQSTEAARKAKWSGAVTVSLIVDENGMPQNIQVVKALGLDLDQKAIEAIQQWRFKPGTKDGKPVPVHAIVEVNFRL